MNKVSNQIIFEIEDDFHAEHIADFTTLKEAISKLKRIATIPWDHEPNRAPCTGWRTCGRIYVINEFDTTTKPWTSLNRIYALDVGPGGAS